MSTTWSIGAAHAQAVGGLNAFISTNAYIDIYSATRVATPETSATGGGSVLLATFQVSGAMTESNGVLTYSTGTASGSANCASPGGTVATWCRFTKSDHSTVICDGDVTTTPPSDSIGMSSTTITQNLVLAAITNGTLAVPSA